MTTWRHSEPASRTLRKANSLMMLPMSCSRCLSFCQVAQTRRNFRGTLRLSATCGNFPMHQLRCRSQHGARDKSYSARLRRRARHGSLSYPHPWQALPQSRTFGRYRLFRLSARWRRRRVPSCREQGKMGGWAPKTSRYELPTNLVSTLTAGSQRLHDCTAVDNQTGASDVAACLAGQ